MDNYLNLLKTILDNSRNLKNAATILLKASLNNPKLRPYAQFMMYASIEECGKFLLIMDHFQKSLSDRSLENFGFYSHDEKIKRLVANIRKYESNVERDDVKIAKTIRKKLREVSVYVDFKDGKVIPPQFVKKKQSLYSLVSLSINCIKFCEFKLAKFKNKKSMPWPTKN